VGTLVVVHISVVNIMFIIIMIYINKIVICLLLAVKISKAKKCKNLIIIIFLIALWYSIPKGEEIKQIK